MRLRLAPDGYSIGDRKLQTTAIVENGICPSNTHNPHSPSISVTACSSLLANCAISSVNSLIGGKPAIFRFGYALICLGLEDFYIRRVYLRIQAHYYASIALDEQYRALLMLGFTWWSAFLMTITGHSTDEYCTPRVTETLKRYSASTCITRVDGGTTALHIELENVVADFVGKPAAMVTGMGYVTNFAILPILVRHVCVLALIYFTVL
ncbi:hypothetical protein L2E82_31999 [Cichorium intybus]|uniref:Uncharacterized protein n=1 Tax=Cichorium intybus TaxID=13427 RepID=A0ACB9BGC9_CICIN|nr:hypothetical protein L2E82_31999 [Cichorium intybus]